MTKSPEEEHPRKAVGWAARDSSALLSPFKFSRRANGDDDITIKILYCGICHSDLHFAKNDWGFSVYPMVPGIAINMKLIRYRYLLSKIQCPQLMVSLLTSLTALIVCVPTFETIDLKVMAYQSDGQLLIPHGKHS